MSESANDNGKYAIPETKRLQRLRVGVKLMLLIAFLVCVYVIFSAFRSGDTVVVPKDTLQVDLSRVVSGQSLLVDWSGRPVLIVRRTQEQIQRLNSSALKLADVDSRRSEQPAFAQNTVRSADPQWFVAIAMGTDFSCIVSLETVPQDVSGVAELSGLRDSCRGSYYDLAGRVFSGQFAERNLTVPTYRLNGEELQLGN